MFVIMEKVIDIFGEIGKDTTLRSIQAQITGEEESYLFRINSPGGSVFEGYAMYHYIKSLNKPVKVHIESYCGSIATIIAFAANKENRLMRPVLSRFFVHEPQSIGKGTANQLMTTAKEVEKIRAEVVELYASESGKSIEEIALLLENTAEMTYQEALDYGFIGGPIPEKELEGAAMLAYDEYMNFIKNQNQPKMEKQPIMEKLIGQMTAFLNLNKAKMIAGTLPDGTAITIDSEGIDDMPGKGAILTDSGEAAPDGTHEVTIGDKMYSVVTEGGKVVSVTESASSDDLKKENEQLKAEVEALKAAKAEAESAKAELKKIEAEKAKMIAEVAGYRSTLLGSDKSTAKAVEKGEPEPAKMKRPAPKW